MGGTETGRKERKADKKRGRRRKKGTEKIRGTEITGIIQGKKGGREGKGRGREVQNQKKGLSLTICPVVLVTTASTGSMERGRFTASGKLIVSSVADPDPLVRGMDPDPSFI